MRRILLLAVTLAPLASQAVPLNDDFNLDIDLALVSDYRSRGISQTQNDPAAQLGLTLQHASGLYLGAWTSNVDFGFGAATRQEVDYYAGWFWQANDDISLDLGYLQYRYPKNSEFNQSEYYAVLTAYGFSLGANYSDDAENLFGPSQDILYSYVGYETQLPLDVGLHLRYGRMDFKDPMFMSASEHFSDAYHEWEVKLTRELLGVTWGLSYIDTDLSKAECASSYGFDDVCEATLVASVGKKF
ncbi:TorF family putative porin [Pseudomonas wadenswilerensis]